MKFGILILHFYFPECQSLKEKRSRIKPMLHQLQNGFNISVSEVDFQDKWKEALIVCGMVSNDANHIQRSLQTVYNFTENKWPENQILEHRIEFI